jgi:deazaflavin-dependent oxidoreductase (nitroreductase family)
MSLQGEYAPSTSAKTRREVDEYERTGGVSPLNRGKPIVVLTTVGAKSGKIRKNALMRVEHDGKYAVVASQGGAPRHPAWYHNLVSHPHVELQDGAVKGDYIAHEATGDERAEWWERAAEAWPDYNEYTKRTSREIPVFVLSPLEGDDQADGESEAQRQAI